MTYIQTGNLSLKNTILYGVLVMFLLALAVLMVPPAKVHAAACTLPETDYGSATANVSIPTTGSYLVWSRIKAPDSTNNSYLLEIDGNTCYLVGDSAIPADTWTWVNYQNGNTSSTITADLSAGSHSVKLIGREANVQVDRVLFLTDTSCVPTGTGDNCAQDGSTTDPEPDPDPTPDPEPEPEPTPDPNPTPDPEPEPEPEPEDKQGDLNGDGKIDIFDLSILLAGWGKTPSDTAKGDLNGDGKIDIIDLSMLLSRWGS